jgi:hypothetical protein
MECAKAGAGPVHKKSKDTENVDHDFVYVNPNTSIDCNEHKGRDNEDEEDIGEIVEMVEDADADDDVEVQCNMEVGTLSLNRYMKRSMNNKDDGTIQYRDIPNRGLIRVKVSRVVLHKLSR